MTDRELLDYLKRISQTCDELSQIAMSMCVEILEPSKSPCRSEYAKISISSEGRLKSGEVQDKERTRHKK